jgi:hypothetical protein
MGLLFFRPGQNRLKMRRLFLGGDDADFDLLKSGSFQSSGAQSVRANCVVAGL